ncbi:Protein of unknown function [Gryllus bimaculatus]|nr:Protein of unknown function [Gryllus bimaculatus]
MHLRGH